jgi:tetratricopeptide (TPR) repeat protein
LHIVNRLGGVYMSQDKSKEAGKFFRLAESGFKKALGPGHPSRLAAVENLTNLDMSVGELKNSEEKLQGTLELADTLAKNMTTQCKMTKGQLEESVELYEQALARAEKQLDPENSFHLYVELSLTYDVFQLRPYSKVSVLKFCPFTTIPKRAPALHSRPLRATSTLTRAWTPERTLQTQPPGNVGAPVDRPTPLWKFNIFSTIFGFQL